jgi:hypothetical protein
LIFMGKSGEDHRRLLGKYPWGYSRPGFGLDRC